jgi:hypothetical protein
LLDTGRAEDACESASIGFAYSGSAQYTDSTTTALTASTSKQTGSGQLTLRATVIGANAASDGVLPTGPVTFETCPTASCGSVVPLETVDLGPGGIATVKTSSLQPGVNYLRAAYGGEGTDYAASVSSPITLAVGAAVTSAATAEPGATSSLDQHGAAATTAPGSVAFTGADIASMVLAALLFIATGAALVAAACRRARRSES